MREHIKNGVECEQMKRMKSSATKKTGNHEKNVSVPVLFLYFESYLCKMLIYSVLLYIKITFTRFPV